MVKTSEFPALWDILNVAVQGCDETHFVSVAVLPHWRVIQHVFSQNIDSAAIPLLTRQTWQGVRAWFHDCELWHQRHLAVWPTLKSFTTTWFNSSWKDSWIWLLSFPKTSLTEATIVNTSVGAQISVTTVATHPTPINILLTWHFEKLIIQW